MELLYQDRSPEKLAGLAQFWLKNAGIFYRYEEQAEKIYGLTSYIPTNTDLSRRESGSNLDRNIYIHYLETGVGAYITCSNRNHEAAPCQHHFGLEPELKASVDIIYRKGMLSHWREIQDSVTKALLGFRIDTEKPTTPQSSQFPSHKQE